MPGRGQTRGECISQFRRVSTAVVPDQNPQTLRGRDKTTKSSTELEGEIFVERLTVCAADVVCTE